MGREPDADTDSREPLFRFAIVCVEMKLARMVCIETFVLKLQTKTSLELMAPYMNVFTRLQHLSLSTAAADRSSVSWFHSWLCPGVGLQSIFDHLQSVVSAKTLALSEDHGKGLELTRAWRRGSRRWATGGKPWRARIRYPRVHVLARLRAGP